MFFYIIGLSESHLLLLEIVLYVFCAVHVLLCCTYSRVLYAFYCAVYVLVCCTCSMHGDCLNRIVLVLEQDFELLLRGSVVPL